MDIHEYQAKKILAGFGVTIPRGGIAYSPENAENKAREIGGSSKKEFIRYMSADVVILQVGVVLGGGR